MSRSRSHPHNNNNVFRKSRDTTSLLHPTVSQSWLKYLKPPDVAGSGVDKCDVNRRVLEIEVHLFNRMDQTVAAENAIKGDV